MTKKRRQLLKYMKTAHYWI